jgi:hypothetical protein
LPIIAEVQTRLRGAFPKSTDTPLLRAVKEGILLADDLFSDGSFLSNSLGRDIRGHVRRVAISTQVQAYCERGDLPFVAQLTRMPCGPWHWLELRATGALAHACRTDDVFKFPDDAESRQDMRLAIQPDLLAWASRDKSMAQIIREVPTLYAWLMFRVTDSGALAHLCWGSPAHDCDEWIAYVDVLREIAHAAPEPPSTPIPDPKSRLRLREHVARTLEEATKEPPKDKA